MSKTQPELGVAIVGMGPRGLSVLERLMVRLSEREGPAMSIWVFDPGEHGAGRIWRTDQPDWFMMNTPSGEVTMYSGDPDEGPPRAGSGPSLHQWLLAGHGDLRWSALDESGYAPRSIYGKYLRDVFENLIAHGPDNVKIHPVHALVERIRQHDGRMHLTTNSGQVIVVDKVVLTTGHPINIPSQWEQELLDYADSRSQLRYVRGDSAADMNLTGVNAGESVGILGLGLTFLDVVMDLTVGRGGVFDAEPSGRIRYLPSGREPRIFAGSRSGLPMLARGVNQKAPKFRYQARFLTQGAIANARRRAQRENGSTQLDFCLDVLPLLKMEVEHAYYTTLVRNRWGEVAAKRFARRHLTSAGLKPPGAEKLLAEFGIAHSDPIDLERIARPFSDRQYEGTAEFHRHVLDVLRRDLAEAWQGNMQGPIKAALDILRDLRGAVRTAVDYGGLRPESHRDDFLGWFSPINTMLSAGPPAIRIAQVCALIEAGSLRLIGPAMEVSCDAGGAGFVLDSAQVGGAGQVVTTLIDARIPPPSVRQDCSPLTRQLLADGLISEYVNTTPGAETGFATGAVHTTRAPFHVVGSHGRVSSNMYALGIPTEKQRWFTQIGNGRPGPLSGFHADADAIARDVLASLPAATGVGVPEERQFITGDGVGRNFCARQQPACPSGVDHDCQ